ncbi:MAG: hypothetical protein U5J95_11030 [Balneolaceae bacterium]|nr:hypothetical protein [Balneolaceae bacterium]
MEQSHSGLGLCFFGNQLFYAVNDKQDSKKLARIGCFDFNFEVTQAIINGDEDHFPGIQQTIAQLKEQYSVGQIRILSLPYKECWTTVPKLVYDNPDEREAHINILMNGVERKKIHPTWYKLSNQDYKFLMLRNEEELRGLKKLIPSVSSTDLISEFELGDRWEQHTEAGGSFMTICCFNGCISVCSYILGKMRGATYIKYDDIEDLPYLWLQQTRQLNWMKGLHEEFHVYGEDAYKVIEILEPFWDDAGTVIKMDTLRKIQVEAEEQTYSFNLEKAYPAILLALG